jgi:hypothetical protein
MWAYYSKNTVAVDYSIYGDQQRVGYIYQSDIGKCSNKGNMPNRCCAVCFQSSIVSLNTVLRIF